MADAPLSSYLVLCGEVSPSEAMPLLRAGYGYKICFDSSYTSCEVINGCALGAYRIVYSPFFVGAMFFE